MALSSSLAINLTLILVLSLLNLPVNGGNCSFSGQSFTLNDTCVIEKTIFVYSLFEPESDAFYANLTFFPHFAIESPAPSINATFILYANYTMKVQDCQLLLQHSALFYNEIYMDLTLNDVLHKVKFNTTKPIHGNLQLNELYSKMLHFELDKEVDIGKCVGLSKPEYARFRQGYLFELNLRFEVISLPTKGDVLVQVPGSFAFCPTELPPPKYDPLHRCVFQDVNSRAIINSGCGKVEITLAFPPSQSTEILFKPVSYPFLQACDPVDVKITFGGCAFFVKYWDLSMIEKSKRIETKGIFNVIINDYNFGSDVKEPIIYNSVTRQIWIGTQYVGTGCSVEMKKAGNLTLVDFSWEPSNFTAVGAFEFEQKPQQVRVPPDFVYQ